MKYRRLGSAGIKLSELAFGSWLTFGDQINESNSKDLIKLAFNSGVNFFDNAEGYANGNSEIIMGKAIQDLPRDEIVISTKLFFGTGRPAQNTKGLSRKHLFDGLHASLKRLNLEYVDLLFCHRHDPEVSMEEVVRTMNSFIDQGKILYWGTSQWNSREVNEAIRIANELKLIPPTMEQPQYNLLNRESVEHDLAPVCDSGLGLTTWSPLASGMLTGKYQKGIPDNSRLSKAEWLRDKFNDSDRNLVSQFVSNCEKENLLPSQVAIKWCLLNNHVSSVILGASNAEQLEQNLKSIDLDEEIVRNIVTESLSA